MATANDVRAEQLLRIPEVAARLGVHRSTVYDLIAAQRIAVHNLGTGAKTILRVSEADLAAYVESTKVQPLKSGRAA